MATEVIWEGHQQPTRLNFLPAFRIGLWLYFKKLVLSFLVHPSLLSAIHPHLFHLLVNTCEYYLAQKEIKSSRGWNTGTVFCIWWAFSNFLLNWDKCIMIYDDTNTGPIPMSPKLFKFRSYPGTDGGGESPTP